MSANAYHYSACDQVCSWHFCVLFIEPFVYDESKEPGDSTWAIQESNRALECVPLNTIIDLIRSFGSILWGKFTSFIAIFLQSNSTNRCQLCRK
jgi:hypothetical protein